MSWLPYLLTVNISLTLCYLLYQVAFAGETFFRFNRIYLLATLISSFAIPFVNVFSFVQAPITQTLILPLKDVASYTKLDNNTGFDWHHIILNIYIIGTILSAALFIRKLYIVKQLLSTAHKRAFSFWKWKRIDSSMPNYQIINAHEQAHIDGLHSADVLLFELAAIILWFNPIVYLYKRQAKRVHEYLADEAALLHIDDKRQYAYLLLESAMGSSPTLTHSFKEKSLLKKRLYMLQRPASSKCIALRYLLVIPLFSLMVFLSSLTYGPPAAILKASIKSRVPEFPGGINRFSSYLSESIKHSNIFTHQALPQPVTVSFMVDVDGSLTAVEALGDANEELKKEAVRIVSDCPKWHPGLANGVPVKVQYQINLNYKPSFQAIN